MSAPESVDVEALEAERDFLLRSLDDLEDERAAANIDDETYQRLHDDYTARASAVIRSLDGDAAVTLDEESSERTPRLTRVLTIGGIVAFAVVAAFLLTHAIGQRRAGQTITGNAQSSSQTTTADDGPALAAAVKAAPKSYDARIDYARYLLSKSDAKNAIEQYDAAAQLDPKQPEPLAYGGWIRALVAEQVTSPNDRKLLVQSALDRINAAIAVDSKYQDAWVFKGLILMNLQNDPADAVPAFQEFLVLAPQDHPLRQQVLDALAQATEAASTTTTTHP